MAAQPPTADAGLEPATPEAPAERAGGSSPPDKAADDKASGGPETLTSAATADEPAAPAAAASPSVAPAAPPPVVPAPAVEPAPAQPAPPAAAANSNELSTEWLLAMLREHGPITLIVSAAAFVRAFRLREAVGSLIGDEVWYVQAARVIAGLPVLMHHLSGNAKSGLDPNTEHPALGKLVIAAFLKVMGNHEIAWRLPSVILGTLAVWLIYKVVLALHASKNQALFAAFILAFDNLFLIHGRIATLDIYLVTFILLGTWIYLLGYLELAGVAFAVGALCKTNALLGVFTMLLYDAVMARSQWRRPSWPAIGRRALFVGFFLGFFLLGLGAMDCFFTEFRGPFEHLDHMAKFHASLKHEGPPTGSESIPFQWWLNEGHFDYYFLKVTNGNNNKHLLFRAAMNFYVIFAAPLAFLYAAQKLWKERSPLATFAVVSLFGNFFPIFMAWAVFSRTSYIYYMLPSVPAMACALALVAYAVPTFMRWGFIALVLYGFIFAYPIQFFL
jgi:predicted membrane-bound dolichyl-phosphate-mannose-protein mannosyltransferase